METFPELYTPRLKLRRLTVDDVPALVKYANNRKISDNIANIPHPYQEPDAVFRISHVLQGFKTKAGYAFSIILKERDEFIGEISLHRDNKGEIAQMGYWIGEPFWGQGIITEAVAAVLKFGFEKLGLDMIFATCREENIASAKVLVKNGMVQVSRENTIHQYKLTREAYFMKVADSLNE